MALKSHVAEKEHRCDTCGRKIPVGARYWRDWDETSKDFREHTNCLDYRDQPLMHPNFNKDRRSGLLPKRKLPTKRDKKLFTTG